MSGRRRPLAVVWSGDIHVFARANDLTLWHWWSDGPDWWGPVSLGGTLVSDPLPGPGRSVIARCTGNTLQRWSWDGAQFRMRGPERLPGALATPPVAAGDWLITRSVEGRLLRWWRTGADWRGPEPLGPPDIGTSLNRVAFDPALAADEAGSYHTFWRTQADRRLVWWSWSQPQSQWLPASRLGTQALASDPVVLPSPGRLDVYAPGDDGRLWHWGRESGKWWPINPPEQEPRGARVASDPVLVAMADGRRDIFARAPDGALAHWWRSEGWDLSAGTSTWKDGTRGRLRASDPAAVAVSGGQQLVVFALDHDGALLQWQRTPPDYHHPTEPGHSHRDTWHLHDGPDWHEDDFWTGPSRVVTTAHARPARWQDADPPAGVPTDPQFLLYRPDDLVLLGIRWSGLAVVAAGRGELPALRATSGDARLVATLPPQHLGEQVRPGGQHPPAPRHWQARLAGPSRVVVQVTGQAPIPLTPSDLLAALSAGEVVPGTGESGVEQTAIELPWQLLMSPVAGAPAAPIRAHHPAGPVASSDAAVGLWQTRLRAGDHHPVTGGAGLGYLPLRVGGAEPFDVPLPRAGRQLVRSQATPAQLDRLELSALGGSVSVHGRWDTFEWEHEAALGRDLRVRTLARGVLYPLGHRAEYVELTVRRYEEPWALLVKERAIVVTEPVRTGLDSRAFPFSEVELTTQVFTDLRAPNWWSQERPVTALAQLEAQLEQHRRESLRLWSGLSTHLAATVEQRAATEPAVAAYLRVQDEIALTRDAIAALTHADPADRSVPVFCWPHRRRGGLVRFPVRCAGGREEVRFDLPLIFVSDVAEPATPLLGAFSSLGNDAIARRLAGAYTGTDPHDGVATPAGEVTVPGTPVWLADGQVHEVHELNVAGQLDGSGFRPRLGSGPGGRAESRWACRLELPELRTLLSDHRRVPVRYADRYEHGDSVKIPLVVAGPAVDVDFAGRKERSGGLVAPSFALTGLHRDYGLVNSAGVESLSPADLFTGDATLLGFDLAALVRRITKPPAITSRQDPGQPPVIEMRWEGVPVDSHPPLRSNGSTLTLRVTQAGDQAETYCEVTSFSLLLPPADPVLELSFERLAFTQRPGRQPVLDLAGVSARFLGDLRLLQLLQEKVGLGTATPGIEATGSGIVARYALPVPDARAGAFVMTNLAFHAAVEVPFRGGAPVVSLGFASRERPFTLSVLMFGGGGYADLAVDHQGLRRLEIALEFGGYVAVDFVVARAQVHALGGIRFEVAGGRVALTGYLRIGGSVELLGLISVAVELTVQLTFREPNDLVGRATLVLEVDLLLYSTSVELDTGEWVIHGGGTERAAALTGPARAGGVENWQRYWGAFR